jgi:hypothetical protein
MYEVTIFNVYAAVKYTKSQYLIKCLRKSQWRSGDYVILRHWAKGSRRFEAPCALISNCQSLRPLDMTAHFVASKRLDRSPPWHSVSGTFNYTAVRTPKQFVLATSYASETQMTLTQVSTLSQHQTSDQSSAGHGDSVTVSGTTFTPRYTKPNQLPLHSTQPTQQSCQ